MCIGNEHAFESDGAVRILEACPLAYNNMHVDIYLILYSYGRIPLSLLLSL